jgi:hypothetical protein
MSIAQSDKLNALYEQDETAWLERSAHLIQEGRLDELDCENLREFLDSMAKRDRREVESRLALLLAHLLKWTYQPENRTRGWRATIELQRHELGLLLQSGTLVRHAQAELATAFDAALRLAIVETGLPREVFPQACPFTVEQLLEVELPPIEG